MCDDLERIAAVLEESGEYRVLRRVVTPRVVERDPVPAGRVGVVLDCETTGLNPSECQVIELGMVRFEYDADGIRQLLGTFSALQQPPYPISAEVTAITGLGDADVEGHRIDDAEVAAFVAGADLVIAHNARFDRAFAEARWPVFEERAWGCSLDQVPWRAEGFEAARLKLLLSEAGFFHRGHRALDDAIATLHLLGLPLPHSKRTGFDHLIERTARNAMRVWALDAPFAAKEVLKMRGYRWSDGSDGLPRAWNIEVAEASAAAELGFLEDDVYRGWSPAIAVPVSSIDRFTTRAGRPSTCRGARRLDKHRL